MISGKAVVLVAHGSRTAGFDRPVRRLAAALRRTGGYARVETAYLEITQPDVPTAVASAVRRGAREIRILPYFLLGGRHVQEDLPRLCRAERRKYRGIPIKLCRYLGFHEKILAVVLERIERPL